MSEGIDLSDEGLVARYGDIMHEYPELFDAIRMHHDKSRQKSSGGVRLSCTATRFQSRSTATTVSEE